MFCLSHSEVVQDDGPSFSLREVQPRRALLIDCCHLLYRIFMRVSRLLLLAVLALLGEVVASITRNHIVLLFWVLGHTDDKFLSLELFL